MMKMYNLLYYQTKIFFYEGNCLGYFNFYVYAFKLNQLKQLIIVINRTQNFM